MARTHESGLSQAVPLSRLPAAALRAVLREGYTKAQFKRDLLAGAVVGVVALPLAMALAVAVGAPPKMGLYTAIVAGFLTALLGGSRIQVVGPTAAFVVLLAPIEARFGLWRGSSSPASWPGSSSWASPCCAWATSLNTSPTR